MMRSAAGTPIGVLRSPATIRERSRNILEAAAAGRSKHFRIDQSRLDVAAARVEAVTRRRYGDLRIPYHSRWRHFEAGGVDRKADLDRALAGRDPTACARARVDLTVVSVLLDAGAGAAWGYVERETGVRYTRSEGLGVASFRAFLAGAFSARRDDPLRADAAALSRIDAPSLAKIFNVDPANPLVGLEGRALGEVTKFLVYNARKRQQGGDSATNYFLRTECVAGVQDMRFQELMPDVLHWLGVTRIDRFVSMSDIKFKPLVESGIEVVERVEIPPHLIPHEASVEMDAKKAAGYFTSAVPDAAEIALPKGRGLGE